MKKTLVSRIITIVLIVLVAALFVYFYVQISRLGRKIGELQQTTAENSAKVTAIVNFFNASLNANQ